MKPSRLSPCVAAFALILATCAAPQIRSEGQPVAPVADATATVTPAALSAAREALLQGVTEIAGPGSPGAVEVYGPNAEPLVVGKAGSTVSRPVAAFAFAGRGRVVALGHDGYLSSDNGNVGQTRLFLQNAVRWLQNGRAGRIGMIAPNQEADIRDLLGATGPTIVPVTSDNLVGVTTLIVNGHALEAKDEAPLRAFLDNGGGLLAATTGWGWKWNDTSVQFGRDFSGNKILAPYGLIWTLGMVEKTTPGGFSVQLPAPLSHAGRAITAFETVLRTGTPLSPSDTAQCSAAIEDVIGSLSPSDTVVRPRLQAMLASSAGDVVPTRLRPVTTQEPIARLKMVLQTELEKNLAPEQVRAQPAGEVFPGEVTSIARPVTKAVEVDLSVPDWHSTGLYANPGSVITITLPDGAQPRGLGVRIGCHTDQLWGLDRWERAPDISRAWGLSQHETKVANPFGGLIYITVPDNATGTLQVSVAGGYEAPLFVQGKTDLNQWKSTLRWLPGPWAEIATDRVIITVPSRDVRDLDDPNQVCDLYNHALMAMADFRGIERLHSRPERIVADQQISAGYMHSGYPIMTGIDVEKWSVDYDHLTQSSWGHWHELGHNHQVSDWTFEGTGEVTNNLFALYVWETVIGKTAFEAHEALRPEWFAREWAKYDANGRKFSDWQSNPFLALHMYLQVKNAFGWEPFKQVFRVYAALPDNQRPKTDDEKRDQWLVRFSRAVGRNLGPFYQAWGVPTSQAARDSLKDLPTWFPTQEQSLGVAIHWPAN